MSQNNQQRTLYSIIYNYCVLIRYSLRSRWVVSFKSVPFLTKIATNNVIKNLILKYSIHLTLHKLKKEPF